jgi:hypothetical protein
VKTSWLSDLIAQLDTRYPASGQARPSHPSPRSELEWASVRQRSKVAPDRKRRRRKSALDQHKHLAEAFIKARARSTHHEAFTYEALAERLEQASGRRFAVSTIQRRMKHWGLQSGMQEYKK